MKNTDYIDRIQTNLTRTGLFKIEDCKYPCNNPEHNPPGHIVLKPGRYEYICPGCGHRQTFTVPSIMW